MRALAADGVSQREIARRLGINRRTGSQLDPLEPVLRLVEEWPTIKAPRATEVLREHGSVGSVDRLEDPDAGREWFLRNTRLFSVHDLSEPPWSTVCDAGTVERFESDEWALADDVVPEREFAELLYACLYEKTKRELRYLGREKLFYARPGRDLEPRRLRASGRRRRGRIVFRAYESKKRAGEIGFCKHWGFHAHFRRYGGRWYLAIDPTYHYTFDGYKKSRFAGDYLAYAKRQERNDACPPAGADVGSLPTRPRRPVLSPLRAPQVRRPRRVRAFGRRQRRVLARERAQAGEWGCSARGGRGEAVRGMSGLNGMRVAFHSAWLRSLQKFQGPSMYGRAWTFITFARSFARCDRDQGRTCPHGSLGSFCCC